MDSNLRDIRSRLRSRELGLLLLIVVLGAVVATVDTGFLEIANLRDILVRSAPTLIVACGVMLVVASGEIDISVGSLMALLGAGLGIVVSQQRAGMSLWIGIPATLILGTLVGTISGCLVTYGRVPSLLATLGMLTGLRGATTLMMEGRTIDRLPEGLSHAAKYGWFGLPLGVWLAAVTVVATGILIHYTPFGCRIYALGSSRYAARMTGLATHRLRMGAFAYAGFLTGVATIAEVPRLPKIESGLGTGFELLVITVVVVGGVSVSGGRGRLRGVVLATVLMTMLRPTLTFLDVGEAGEKWTRAVQGALILLAVVCDSWLAQDEVRHDD